MEAVIILAVKAKFYGFGCNSYLLSFLSHLVFVNYKQLEELGLILSLASKLPRMLFEVSWLYVYSKALRVT